MFTQEQNASMDSVHLEAELDSIGGRKEKKDSVKNITDIKLAYDLVDICDPPYENTSYPQKRFLGGLRSL